MTKKFRSVGRPKLAERTNLTKAEIEYARWRADEKTIAEASEAVGIPSAEMARREREFPLLAAEIDRQRGENTKRRLATTVRAMEKTTLKMLDSVKTSLDDPAGTLTLTDITKASNLIEKLFQQAREIQTVFDLKEVTCDLCGGDTTNTNRLSIKELLDRIPVKKKLMLYCPGCKADYRREAK